MNALIFCILLVNGGDKFINGVVHLNGANVEVNTYAHFTVIIHHRRNRSSLILPNLASYSTILRVDRHHSSPSNAIARSTVISQQ